MTITRCFRSVGAISRAWQPRPRLGRRQETALGPRWPWQAWWYPRHLLRPDPRRRHLDADDLREKRGTDDPRARAAEDPGADRWLRQSAISAKRFSTASAKSSAES